jgi:hypothetical protein
MITETYLSAAECLVQRLALKIEGLEFPASDRNRLAAACFHQALEHHEAIVVLVRRKLFGSVMALVRPMFEIYIRGVWSHVCASDADLEKFQKCKVRREFAEFVSDIESHEGYNVGVLSRVKKRSWPAMNDYTHGGPLQVIRRITPDSIASQYSDEQISEVVAFAGAVGYWATSEVALFAGREDIATELLGELKTTKKAGAK